MPSPFSVTWDYLCPFARNAHEHVTAALRAGADWDVRFRFFSLAQVHLRDTDTPVWSEPGSHSGVLAGLAGIVVRERHAESFLDAHEALFRARHDRGLDLRDSTVIARVLDEVGLEGASVVNEALSGWPAELARDEHNESVTNWSVFGVPTFIIEDRAVFLRVMTRPEGDAKKAESTVEHVLELMDGFPELNEYKFTTVPR